MNQQERAQALAELERLQRLQEKEEKHTLFNELQKGLEENNKFKHFKEEKQKEVDKHYLDEYTKSLENQHLNRKNVGCFW